MATTKTKLAAAKKIAEKLKAKKSASSKKATTTSKKEKKENLSSVLSKQGQNRPQNPASYTTSADKMESAKNVGVRWTEEGAKKLGKTLTSRPTPEDIERYSGKTFKIARKPNVASTSHGGDGTYRYLYSERRINKSDFNRKQKFEEGGEMVDVSLYRKGGQTQGQYARANNGRYDKASDGQRMAKPVGWRFRGNNYDTPSQQVIDREMKKSPSDRRIYFEQRRDKSDYNPSNEYISLKKGGQTMGQYARANNGRSSKAIDGQRMAKPVGWRFRGNNYDTPSQQVIDREMKKSPSDRRIYFEKRRDKSDYNPSNEYISLKRGGQTMGQNESQYGWRSQKDDARWMAKPVGYRYTNARAKRLGVDEYAKPTIAHIEKYRGNGVYFETRRDKSDLNPSSGR